MAKTVPRVELSELIAYVSAQLRAASEGVDDRGGAIMEFEQCTMEMSVEVEKQGSAGIQVWVVNLGGGASKTSSHTITVSFKPIPGNPVVAAAGHRSSPGGRQPSYAGKKVAKPADSGKKN